MRQVVVVLDRVSRIAARDGGEYLNSCQEDPAPPMVHLFKKQG